MRGWMVGDLVGFPFSAFTTTAVTVVFHDMELDADPRGHPVVS